jgi:hypothetical protein
VDIPSASPALTGTMETAALASGAFTDASYTRSVLYVDCSAITRPGVYDLEVKADLPEHFALLGTATHASALNAPLPVVRVIIHEALH